MILGVFASGGFIDTGGICIRGSIATEEYSIKSYLLLRVVGYWRYLNLRAFAVGFCTLEVSSVARFESIIGSDPMAFLAV